MKTKKFKLLSTYITKSVKTTNGCICYVLMGPTQSKVWVVHGPPYGLHNGALKLHRRGGKNSGFSTNISLYLEKDRDTVNQKVPSHDSVAT